MAVSSSCNKLKAAVLHQIVNPAIALIEDALETFVTTTFFIILMFAVINFLSSAIIWLNSRHQIYARASFFWLALIVNFLVQAQAQAGEARIIWSYAFSNVPIQLLCYASLYFCGARYPWRTFVSLSLVSLVVTALLLPLDLSFTAKALPIAIAPVLPLSYTFYCYLWRNRQRLTPLMSVHTGILLALAIHSINFAVFRMVPAAQLWGWPVAYGLYQLTAVFFPALTLDHMHREEQDRLKRIIDERTRELTEANKNLHHLYRQKDFFFRALTHDISNPLTVIQTKTSMPELCLANPVKFVSDVRNMTDRIAGLIQQVRDYDSIEKRLLTAPPQTLRVLDAIRDCEELFADRLQAKSLSLDYVSDDVAPFVLRVERSSFSTSVLPNLISNAIKFSRVGSKIKIIVGQSDERIVTMSIEDSGIGIPEDMLNKLFDFDANVSRPGTSGERGSGFGLPILARVIRAYGGDIRVDTRVEREGVAGMTRMILMLPGFREPSSSLA